jgi:hypothetical protein
MESAILDTDILNEVLKQKNQQVVATASAYLRSDLIIAATALEHDRALVTGNTPHFSWISGLSLANWRDS